MVVGLMELRTKNHCARNGLQQFISQSCHQFSEHCITPKVMRQYDMVMCPAEIRTKDGCAGEASSN